MDGSERRTALVAAMATLGAHGALLLIVLHPPEGWRAVLGPGAPVPVVLQVEFISRAEKPPSAAIVERPAAQPSARFVAGDAALPAPASLAAVRAMAPLPADIERREDVSGTPPLDLSLPSPSGGAPGAAAARSWLERAGPLAPATTRFEHAWVPAGDAITQARHRSVAVNAALGLFGGPPRRCDEVARRLRGPDCLPLDADEAETEALRRRLDRP